MRGVRILDEIEVGNTTGFFILIVMSSSIMTQKGWREGWEGGSEWREGIYVYIKLIHVNIQQKQRKHFKAIIFQLKIEKKPLKIQIGEYSLIPDTKEQTTQELIIHFVFCIYL